MLYRVLKSQDKLDRFDKKYLTQKNLVVSQLMGGEENFNKDTVVLMSIHKVDFDKKQGNVYVFKMRPKDKKIWKLCYSAVHPADTSTVNLSPRFTKTSFSFENEAQAKKEIDVLLRKIRVESRKRASVSDFEKEFSYGDYSWY